MKKPIIVMLLVLMASSVGAQRVLTLEDCRALARENNRELQMASAAERSAYYQRKSAFTNYLPKVSASGGYLFTSREISLLNDEQKAALPHLGDVAGAQLGQMGQLIAAPLNAVGQGVVDALRTDTRNAGALAVTLTQPIYMGGKIRAYNKIARLAEEAAADKREMAEQDVLVEVDETYWQIVALTSKRKLAESYRALVADLARDVDAMVAEGVATKADALSVRVKVNQADVALIQVDNGLSLLKMLLCQIIGLDPDTAISLADEGAETLGPEETVEEAAGDWQTARPELRALGKAAQVEKQRVNLALSETMPTVALTGGYFLTNPSLVNGFEKKFRNLWSVGVMVNIPIVTWGDRIYKVRKAQADAQIAELRLDETREKIGLQVAQSRQKLAEARERLSACRSAASVAEENLRIATLGLSEGVIPVINVNEAQTAWLGARSELIAAEIDLKLAGVYLRRALGQM